MVKSKDKKQGTVMRRNQNKPILTLAENYERFFGIKLIPEGVNNTIKESSEIDFDPEVETKIELSGQSHDFTYIQNPDTGEGYLFVDGNQEAHWSFDNGGTSGVMDSPSVGELLSWIADIMWASGQIEENYKRLLIPNRLNNTIKESFGVPGEDTYARKAAREISIALNDIEAMGKDVPQEYIDILEDWEDQCEAMDILDIYYNFENVDQELLDLVPNMVKNFTKLYKKGVASGQIEENYKRFYN